MLRQDYLDHGFIELVDLMGDDYRILEAARISTGAQAVKGDIKDRGLIQYLYRNGHLSPFEMVQLTFRIKLPIFVMRQLIRHRTASTNEVSSRYAELPQVFYVPEVWRGEPGLDNTALTEKYLKAMDVIYTTYTQLLEAGVAKELARLILPVSQYTEIYWRMDLRNLFHFLELRLHPHAQYEMQLLAQGILSILEALPELKWSVEAFKSNLAVDTVVQDLKNKYKQDFPVLVSQLEELCHAD